MGNKRRALLELREAQEAVRIDEAIALEPQ
jgi:hypothetical protein